MMDVQSYCALPLGLPLAVRWGIFGPFFRNYIFYRLFRVLCFHRVMFELYFRYEVTYL